MFGPPRGIYLCIYLGTVPAHWAGGNQPKRGSEEVETGVAIDMVKSVSNAGLGDEN